jgi:hypothetical protein
MGSVECGRYASYRLIARLTKSRSWVEIVEADTERLTPLQIVKEAIIRLRCFRLIGLRQIDEIRPVWKYVTSRIVLMRLAGMYECLLIRIFKGRRNPFPLRFEKKG